MTEGDIDRKKEIARIKARMKALGYNQRSLSMQATGKEDSVRNLFSGKSRNWRHDTYKAVMAILWPEEKKAPPEPKEGEAAIIKTIEILMKAVLIRGLLPARDLETLLNFQLRDFRKRDQPGEALVMDQFLDFLHSEFPESSPQEEHKSLPPSRAQSRKEKYSEN